MAGSVRIGAAAKVNLHLRVYDRREDGFHGILSLFQAVSLSDTIVIRSLKASDIIEVEGCFDCPPSSTTVYRAAELYLRTCGLAGGLAISVDKRIPAGAGLGGGSSDAAAVLLGLEALFGAVRNDEELARLGGAIGSDVPFFLGKPAALVSGRGEIVDPIEPRTDFALVLVDPGFPVSTARAYGLLDRWRERGAGLKDREPEGDPSAEEIASGYRRPAGAWGFFNSFTEPIAAEWPRIGEAKRLLKASRADFAEMSGSGSAVYGVFEEEGGAAAAVEALSRAGFSAHEIMPLARYPVVD